MSDYSQKELAEFKRDSFILQKRHVDGDDTKEGSPKERKNAKKPLVFHPKNERHQAALSLTTAILHFQRPEKIPLNDGSIGGNTETLLGYFHPDQQQIINEQKAGILKAAANAVNCEVSWVLLLLLLKDKSDEAKICKSYVAAVTTVEANGDKNVQFVDHCGRVYAKWTDFCNKNVFLDCYIAYPANGEYSETLVDGCGVGYNIVVERTAASKWYNKAAKVADCVIPIASAAVPTVLALASLCTPIGQAGVVVAGLTAGAGSGYSIVRGGQRIYDRCKRKQSWWVTDREARSVWIGIGIGAAGLVVSVVRVARVCQATALHAEAAWVQRAYNYFLMALVALPVVSLADIACNMRLGQRYWPNAEEQLQLALVLFCAYNVIVDFKTVSSLFCLAAGEIAYYGMTSAQSLSYFVKMLWESGLKNCKDAYVYLQDYPEIIAAFKAMFIKSKGQSTPDKQQQNKNGDKMEHLCIRWSLHQAVTSGDLRQLVDLYAHGADPNDRNAEGKTPLDLADECANVLAAQHLLCWEAVADGQYKGVVKSLLDELNGPPDPTTTTKYQTSMLEQFHALANKSEYLRLLSIDGGGTRGLAAIQMAMHIESKLSERLKTDVKFSDCFDGLAGNSTGALIVMKLAKETSLRDVQRMYLRFKNEVFQGKRPYDPAPLQRLLKQEFGEDSMLSEFTKHKVMITATRDNVKPMKLDLFRSCVPAEDIRNEEPDYASRMHVQTHKVARKTTAAPTYFPSSEGHMDGGCTLNNPTSRLISEVKHLAVDSKTPPRIGCVVSLGTGVPAQKKVHGVDLRDINGLNDLIGNALILKEVTEMFIEQVTNSDGEEVVRARDSANAPFFRFSPQLYEEILLDKIDDSKLIRLMWLTKVYITRHCQKQVEDLVSVLAAYHEQYIRNIID